MNRDEILTVVKKQLARSVEDLDPEKIDPAVSMKALGASSLDIVEVVSNSMRELKIKVRRPELAGLTNIDGLVDVLHKESTRARPT